MEDCSKLKNIDGTFNNTLDSWGLQFPGAAQCKGPDRRTQAPLSALAGLQAASALFQYFMPKDVVALKNHLLAQGLTQTWLFGYMEDMETILPEPGCLGTMRMHFGGPLLRCVPQAKPAS